MLFTSSITAPPNTPKTAPVKRTMKLHAGVITKISVLIPPGHAALAHLGIFDGETQIMPWGEDQWLEGDSETVSWEPDYPLPSEPAALEARAWNEDDTYAHTFYIRVWVDPEPSKLPVNLMSRVLRLAESFLRRVLGVH